MKTAFKFVHSILKKFTFGISILIFLFGISLGHVKANPSSKDWIIVFKNKVSDPEATANDLTAKHNLTKEHVYKYALKGMAANVPDSKLDVIKKDPNVAYIYPDLLSELDGFNIDPNFPYEFYDGGNRRVTHLLPVLPLLLPLSTEGLELPENMGQDVGIAILDTGIDSSHPDLRLGSGPGIDGDSTIQHYFDCLPSAGKEDFQYHGTYVSGAIYMQPNGIGGVGLAPKSRLWDVRMNKGSFTPSTLSDEICAVDFVTSMAPGNTATAPFSGGPIQVASMSHHFIFGDKLSKPHSNDCGNTPGQEDPYHQALCAGRDAGIIWVAAAGNDHAPVTNRLPAFYDDAVITVSAFANSSAVPITGNFTNPLTFPCTDPRFPEFGILVENTFTTFSDYDPNQDTHIIDLAAPGCNVATTIPLNQDFWEHWLKVAHKEPDFNKNQQDTYYPYTLGNGTSIATPMVAGSVALWINKYKNNPDFDIYQDTYDPNDNGYKDRLLKLVLKGTNPNNVEFDPNETIPGLIDLAEKIGPTDCQTPPTSCLEHPEQPCADPNCPHYNYRIPAPDESPDNVHVHPEPVLDVRTLLNL